METCFLLALMMATAALTLQPADPPRPYYDAPPARRGGSGPS